MTKQTANGNGHAITPIADAVAPVANRKATRTGGQTLRNVTRKCVVCERPFRPHRRDARYCSSKCRQRAHRCRVSTTDIDRRIEATRLEYWKLIAEKAAALGRHRSNILTGESQYVDEAGNVFVGGVLGGGGWRFAGRIEAGWAGWTAWGLEAAGPPWAPPTHHTQARAAGQRRRDKEPELTEAARLAGVQGGEGAP